jgi:hypothetical protein
MPISLCKLFDPVCHPVLIRRLPDPYRGATVVGFFTEPLKNLTVSPTPPTEAN